MMRTFVETSAFTDAWRDLGLNDDDLRDLQNRLLANPDAGDIIQDTGGVQKIRVPCNGHGTRGGARVLYIDVIKKESIYLLSVYAKNEKENITSKEKKALAALARILKGE